MRKPAKNKDISTHDFINNVKTNKPEPEIEPEVSSKKTSRAVTVAKTNFAQTASDLELIDLIMKEATRHSNDGRLLTLSKSEVFRAGLHALAVLAKSNKDKFKKCAINGKLK